MKLSIKGHLFKTDDGQQFMVSERKNSKEGQFWKIFACEFSHAVTSEIFDIYETKITIQYDYVWVQNVVYIVSIDYVTNATKKSLLQ